MKKALVLVFVISLVGLADGASRSRGLREPLLVVPSTASPGIKDMARAEGGWVCDGDGDENEINAAIQSAHAGGRVLCAAGTYSITGPIILRSNVEVRFAPGNEVQIPSTHNFNAAANRLTVWSEDLCAIVRNENAGDGGSGDSGIVLDGMYLNVGAPTGSSKLDLTTATAGIFLQACSNSRITNCRVKDVVYDINGTYRAYGILLTQCSDCDVLQCRADGAGYEGIGLRSGNKRCTVRGCVGENNKVHFAQVARWVGATHYGTGVNEDILVEDCRSASNGIIMHGRGESPVSRGVFANNRIKWITLDGLLYHCDITANTARQIACKASEASMVGVNITNNCCRMEDGGAKAPTGIYLHAYNTGGIAKQIMVANNLIGEGQILLAQDAGKDAVFEDVTIQGNIVSYDSSDTLEPRLIELNVSGSGTMKRIAIMNNRLCGLRQASPTDYNDAGVYIVLATGSTTSFEDLLVQGNDFYARYAVKVAGSGTGSVTNLCIMGNVCDVLSTVAEVTAAVSKLAVLNNYIMTTGRVVNGAADDVLIHGNVLGAVTTALYASATNVAVGVNMSWKGGTGWDGAWRFEQDGADADKLYIKKLIGGSWTTAGTFDASP